MTRNSSLPSRLTSDEERALRLSAQRYEFLDRLSEATRALNEAAEIMGVTARMLGEHLKATRCAYADVEPDNDSFTIRNDWAGPGMDSSVGVYSLALFGPKAVTLLHQGQRLVVRDVDRELGDEGGARMFNAIRIKAIVTAPLVKGGRLVAMMAVHSSTPRDWSEADIALVAEVVDRCWAHIERVRDNERLREQDRHKDEFLATLAHELRNPLAPMRYATALMRMAKEPAIAEKARDIIERQVGHMVRLIDDLLDLSRVNRGLIELHQERVALLGLLEQAVEASRPAIDAAGHRLDVTTPDASLMLHADAARVVQMVSNLLNNAAKYTADGGTIGLVARAEADHVLIEVEDNGFGIAPADQSRLFQMFVQLPHTRQHSKGGLGIGLSLVKTLASMHGGAVRVYSAGVGQGARFTIELPLAVPDVEAPASATAGAAESPAGPLGSGQRVLVVEDNDDGRAALVEMLRLSGYHVASAASGPEGLAQAQRVRPQIVLLDLGLPGLDGLEVARRLRSDPDHAHVRLLAVTGWGSAADRARTLAAGFDDHLTKPVDPGVLSERLAFWTGQIERPATSTHTSRGDPPGNA
ncbi:MAG TPA: ATP-binding protein [Methylibium sp.]|uniref:hybrid sensor histidine kinase/response regulator n=1 Tax=Methylibium sp. TaxID=2067992 RepID=UPI002DBA9130|nr:ATP-binding protein [Methylibium sp.]HEU4457792.1 ATP-binding protein [Methylibium sp.]